MVVVQTILDWRRSEEGQVEYYVKWKGRKHAKNTWEPESSLDCKELIEQFVQSCKDKEKVVPSMTGSPDSSTKVPPGDNAMRENTEDEKPSCSTGSARGLVAEKILAPDNRGVEAEEIIAPDMSTVVSPGDNAQHEKTEDEKPSCSTGPARGLEAEKILASDNRGLEAEEIIAPDNRGLEAEEIIAPDRSTVVPPGDNAKRAKRAKTENKKSSGSTGVTRALEAEEIIAPDRSIVVPPGDNAKRAKTENKKSSGSTGVTRALEAEEIIAPDRSTVVPPGDIAKRAQTDDRKPWMTGFDRGLEAEKIIGANEIFGRPVFTIKFKGEELPEVISSTVVRGKIPQMVIDFYEERIEWPTPDQGNPT